MLTTKSHKPSFSRYTSYKGKIMAYLKQSKYKTLNICCPLPPLLPHQPCRKSFSLLFPYVFLLSIFIHSNQ